MSEIGVVRERYDALSVIVQLASPAYLIVFSVANFAR